MECSKCGAPEELAKLFDVISGEGIVKLCQRCLSYDNAPVIKKPSSEQMNNMNKSESMYKRLSNSAGLDPEKHKANLELSKKKELVKKQEVTLRDLVDQKFDKFGEDKPKKEREDLVDNFHWILMRARRSKKMTVSQLAQEIGESEKSIKLAEQGVLPEKDYNLAIKLEEVLGVRILSREVSEQIAMAKKQLGFDKFSTKSITIADLQKMKKEAEVSIDEPLVEPEIPYWRRFVNKIIRRKKEPESPIVVMEEKNEEIEEMEFEPPRHTEVEFNDTSLETSDEVSDQEKKNVEALSQKDMDDIIFGRR